MHYQVIEMIETDDGDNERLVWVFDNEDDAVGLVNYLMGLDCESVLRIVESVVRYG